ncbi:MAG: TadE family protein [Dongiaceae bacterium]
MTELGRIRRLLAALRRAGGAWAAAQSGSVAVEYALTIPILLMFFVGIIETSRVVYADTTLAAATRDGTRFAIVHGAEHPSPATTAQIADYVKSKATALDTDVLTVTVVHTPDNSPGSVVTLQTTYAFRFLLPPFSGEPVSLTSTSSMVISR